MAAGMELSPPMAILDCGEAESMETENSSKHHLNGKPPRHVSAMSSAKLLADADSVLLLKTCQATVVAVASSAMEESPEYLPVFRSGSCAELGPKQHMEDEHVCIDDLSPHLNASFNGHSPSAFYGVFDGHGGTDAAAFMRDNILKLVIEDPQFPIYVQMAIKSAYLKADYAFADDAALDISSGTTALTAIALGRKLIIANAGDCRAVLGRRGRAIELSRDHKPNCSSEKLRIEKLGGVIYDGYLNGQLSVSRSIGDWHMKGMKGSACPLIAEPELQEIVLSEDDEFLLMACDGLWDVMSSHCAVTLARKELMCHNDPELCARALVRAALMRSTWDNLTAIVVCFSDDAPPRIETQQTRVRRSISSEGLNLLKGALNES